MLVFHELKDPEGSVVTALKSIKASMSVIFSGTVEQRIFPTP
jgi:hypothetical protein